MAETSSKLLLQRPVDRSRDHVRGGSSDQTTTVLIYGDYLCPYCRRIRPVLDRLRAALGERFAYVFRHYPNEHAHPGAEFAARAAEAADRQGRFWDMHDALYTHEPPLTPQRVVEIAGSLGLDMDRFSRDVDGAQAQARVAQDIADGRRNGVSGTPTIFIDGVRYDGAWDFFSMLDALERPVAVQVRRTVRTFASLPASAGVVLIVAAVAALICANSPLAPYYSQFVHAPFGIGPTAGALSLTVGEWFSEGLLAIFFLVVGLEIRREITIGDLADWRAAALPVVAAFGGVLAPAAIYLALNSGPTAKGWAVPTATDVAFALGVLAVLGKRVPVSIRVFVASLAVVDDILSMLTLAIFYPHAFRVDWLVASSLAVAVLLLLNRWRTFAAWPYLIVGLGLWFSLHAAGVHAALAGIFVAAFIPTRPTPAAGPLLAQAATALAALEQAEVAVRNTGDRRSIQEGPIWDWASRNLTAASERLLSPADRLERAVSPWAAYLALPLFAFSATGVSLAVNLNAPGAREVFLGVVLGLVFGKPLGISLAALAAVKARVAVAPSDIGPGAFIGAAFVCGIGDTVSVLMADQAFPSGNLAGVAKIGVLAGSVLAAGLGAAIIAITTSSRPPMTRR
jgi:NhaA family Na+:H+ antiporter